ncbi:hypothetical protein ACFWJT_34780 [Streptomyces sp. NPDC127069]|uniref:hypothetical protein n=1 Tax=Streptomyces sp. NPDC127069 TaxID=3347128 RepID=UPI00365D652B
MAVLVEGGYGVVRRDTTRNQHTVTMATISNGIACGLTIWMAARDCSGRPATSFSEF